MARSPKGNQARLKKSMRDEVEKNTYFRIMVCWKNLMCMWYLQTNHWMIKISKKNLMQRSRAQTNTYKCHNKCPIIPEVNKKTK